MAGRDRSLLTPHHSLLAFANGRIFEGEGFGARTTVVGEVVFNTSLTGYQEVLTDPSYRGQMVCMTVPHVGNTGVNREDVESDRPQVTAFIVREVSPVVSNWRANENLGSYLERHDIPGLSQVDTRALTRLLREEGVLHGALCTDGSRTQAELIELARGWEGLDGRDLVQEVTCEEPFYWSGETEGQWDPRFVPLRSTSTSLSTKTHNPNTIIHEDGDDARPLVVAYDFGMKHNILRRLASHNLRVAVVPADTPAHSVLDLDPDGIFLSNGPGDPAGVPYAARAVARLLESGRPMFGICLGHQIIGLALGAETFKLKFGHHGGNQPVSDVDSSNIQITAQNHNYAVDQETLPDNVEVTHLNLNDGTLEGMRLSDRPVFCVQYHPEASPGPHDADLLFARFAQTVHQWRKRKAQRR